MQRVCKWVARRKCAPKPTPVYTEFRHEVHFARLQLGSEKVEVWQFLFTQLHVRLKAPKNATSFTGLLPHTPSSPA